MKLNKKRLAKNYIFVRILIDQKLHDVYKEQNI